MIGQWLQLYEEKKGKELFNEKKSKSENESK